MISKLVLISIQLIQSDNNIVGQLKYIPKATTRLDFTSLLILLSIVFIALARVFNNEIFSIQFQLLFKLKNFHESFKAIYKLVSVSSLFLTLNFLISCFISSYLAFSYTTTLDTSSILKLSGLIPIVLILWTTLGFLITSIILGKFQILKIYIENSFIVLQFLGLALAILNFVWYLNPITQKISLLIFAGILLVFFTYRLFKNFILGIAEKISWYYIILYLCTLEIMPVWLSYYYITHHF